MVTTVGPTVTRGDSTMATYSVTDPSGKIHSKASKTRIYSHACIRQNKGEDDPNHYFVNFASSELAATRESRVQADSRSYIAVVPTSATD